MCARAEERGFPDGLVLTAFRPGDERAILDLFRRVFGRELSPEAWRWKYERLPGALENIILVKNAEGELCGHYAALPLTLIYRGREVPAALRTDFMVHPDHQRKGIGGLLIDTCRRRLAEWCSLHVAFPNPNSTPITVKKGPHFLDEAPLYWRFSDARAALRATGRGELPALLHVLAGGLLRFVYRILALPGSSRRFFWEIGGDFATCFPEDAEFKRPGCGIYFKRDAAFLRWRFDENPERHYALLHPISPGEPGTPEGYAVLAVMEYGGFRLGFIVDLLVDPPRFSYARGLIARAVEWLEAQDVEAVTCMMTGRNAYTRALKSLGFMRVPGRFLPRALNLTLHLYDPELDREYVCDLHNWVITWADTDLV